MSTSTNKKSGPLAGVKVIEMSTVVFGPYGGQIFGDLGAEVIKVEAGSGDVMRLPGNTPVKGMGPIYMALNRNKQSIQLDLSNPAALGAMKKLLVDADVFYTNVRMGGLERLGLSYDLVKAINPNILFVHCTGFDSDGPYGGRVAYDDVIQAAAGFTDLLPRVDGNSTPRYVPSLIADKTAGLHAAYATIAALYHRERTGEGQFVEVPMFEAFTSFNMIENLYEHTFEPATGDVAYTRSIDPNRKPYQTQDGYISIVPYSANDWKVIMSVTGVEGILEDPRFSTYTERTKHIGILYGMLHDITPSKTTDEWLTLLQANTIPCMRVNRLDEVRHDEHLQATGFFTPREHPQVGSYYSIKHPVKFSETPASVRSDAPMLGENSKNILMGLGYDEAEIAEIVKPKAQ
ncbi:CaiB/BaiF CoA transferase family protein [Oceanicoccus sagamiensis]|uniref:Carnitine dehydratase n=1 Tax=Oceanicoccus sagamiensis TaxID=716816 RepID=A0A1X9N4N2_9GAMM|nr:CoA transferase [Oceanicoccus sagamiensis]ARN73098.1 carnitine dehydratase [Oceanicoccus sagamiensis]